MMVVTPTLRERRELWRRLERQPIEDALRPLPWANALGLDELVRVAGFTSAAELAAFQPGPSRSPLANYGDALGNWVRADLSNSPGGTLKNTGGGPAIAWVGAPASNLGLRALCTLGGARGTSRIDLSWNNGSSYAITNIPTAATYTIPSGPAAGTQLQMATGTYILNATYDGTSQAGLDLTGKGNSFAMTSAGLQPVYQVSGFGTRSRPFWRFDGVNDVWLVQGTYPGLLGGGIDTPFVCQLVAQWQMTPPNGGAGNVMCALGQNSPGDFNNFFAQDTTGMGPGMQSLKTGAATPSPRPGWSLNPQLWTWEVGATTWSFYVDGVLQAASQPLDSAASMDYDFLALAAVQRNSATNHAQIDVAEFWSVPGTITAAQLRNDALYHARRYQ